MDGLDYCLVLDGGGLRWLRFWMAWRPDRKSASDGSEHWRVFPLHRSRLFLPRTNGPGPLPVYGRTWDGRGMVPRRGSGHGMLAGKVAPLDGGIYWRGLERRVSDCCMDSKDLC